jgi:hypothetical protein
MLDDLRADVTAALTGTLRSATYAHGEETFDEYGNPSYTWTTYPCEGLRGSYDAEYAGLSGIPRTAAKIELLAGTLAVTPKRLDKIHIESGWWLITEIEIDPATAMWICQCSETSAPA